MTQNQVAVQTDEWSDWLLHRRHADDSHYEHQVHNTVHQIRDRVLNGAKLHQNMVLVDIGAGDGLISFGAIDRIGSSLRVILTDISAPLLHHVESLAIQRGVREQCTFIQGSAENLTQIPDASVDAVTTRAVLTYVADKPAALREFHRILKPGGRLSIAEPVFRDNAYEVIELKKLLDAQAPESRNRFLSLVYRWKAAQFPDTHEAMAKSPIVNYSERDLLRFVTSSGFSEVRFEFHIEVLPNNTNSWEVFLEMSPHPWAPPLSKILAEQFSDDDRQFFEKTLRPMVEKNQSTSTERNVYLTAIKPRAR